jgi:hypothetical protein
VRAGGGPVADFLPWPGRLGSPDLLPPAAPRPSKLILHPTYFWQVAAFDERGGIGLSPVPPAGDVSATFTAFAISGRPSLINALTDGSSNERSCASLLSQTSVTQTTSGF